MVLQTPNTLTTPQNAFALIVGNAQNIKAQAQNALASLQGGSVDSNFIFVMLDQLRNIISSLNSLKVIAGLDAYATAQGYTGSLVSDCTNCANAASTCIAWIVANFPKDSTLAFLLSHTLNADGSRTPRLFTPAQTAGLQTNLQAFIATIG